MTFKTTILIYLAGLSLLISVGCTVRLSNQQLLIMAAANGNAAKVDQLSSNPDVDINAENGDAGPLLCIAAYAGFDDVIDILIKHGAKIDIRDKRSTTPLMSAVIGQKETTVRLLLERGADPSLFILNDNGDATDTNALKLAQMRPNAGITDLLEEAKK